MHTNRNYGVILCLNLIVLLTMLSGCACSHEWNEATCTAPKTCTLCGKTEDEALSHRWQAATCSNPETCAYCGETEGAALTHQWQTATCLNPETCTLCGESSGDALPHKLDREGVCELCGEAVGYALNEKNYAQYISLEYEMTSEAYPTTDWFGTDEKEPYVFVVDHTIRAYPIQHVNFYDVRIEGWWRSTSSGWDSSVYGALKVESDGYGSNTNKQNTSYKFSSDKDLPFTSKPEYTFEVTDVSGYIVER